VPPPTTCKRICPSKDYKRKTSAPVLWSLLLAAAARITSLSTPAGAPRRPLRRDGSQGAAGHTARLRRLAATTQRRAGRSPAKALRKHLQLLAIDLTLIPYHGQPFHNLDEVYRGQAKDGTSHFHAYATAYVVRKGQRYTVALTGVKKGEPLKEVVRRLLHQAASVGVRPRLLRSIVGSTAWRWSATSRRRATRS